MKQMTNEILFYHLFWKKNYFRYIYRVQSEVIINWLVTYVASGNFIPNKCIEHFLATKHFAMLGQRYLKSSQ